jgi:hypothetical protein
VALSSTPFIAGKAIKLNPLGPVSAKAVVAPDPVLISRPAAGALPPQLVPSMLLKTKSYMTLSNSTIHFTRAVQLTSHAVHAAHQQALEPHDETS